MKKNHIVYLLFLFFVISCKKQSNINPHSEQSNNSDKKNITEANNLKNSNGFDIKLEADYLFFNDVNDFYAVVYKLDEMDEKELAIWENKFLGFQSMNSKFIENLVLDTLHFWKKQYIEQIPQNVHVKHVQEIRDSKYMYIKYYFDRSTNQYEEYLNEGSNTDEYLLLKNISIESFANVVNSHGIVRIGDSLFQFTKNWTKSISASSNSNVNKLINANPNANSSGPNKVFFRLGGSVPSVGKVALCDPPSYYYNNEWGTNNTTTFSSNPKYKLYLVGNYYLQTDYNCLAVYTPIVKVLAYSYKKNWFNFSWSQSVNKKTLEVSYSVNNPSGIAYNEYYYDSDISNQWAATYTKVFTSINSQTYSTMFNISNFYSRSTMNGGSSGGATIITH